MDNIFHRINTRYSQDPLDRKTILAPQDFNLIQYKGSGSTKITLTNTFRLYIPDLIGTSATYSDLTYNPASGSVYYSTCREEYKKGIRPIEEASWYDADILHKLKMFEYVDAHQYSEKKSEKEEDDEEEGDATLDPVKRYITPGDAIPEGDKGYGPVITPQIVENTDPGNGLYLKGKDGKPLNIGTRTLVSILWNELVKLRDEFNDMRGQVIYPNDPNV